MRGSHGGGNPRAVSKPCGRGGCTAPVYAWGPRTLEARQFCSPRCNALERMRLGSLTIPLSAQRIGGFLGGRIAGDRRRRKAAARAIERVDAVLSVDILEALTREQIAQLRAAMARLEHEGYRRGLRAAGASRRRSAGLRVAG